MASRVRDTGTVRKLAYEDNTGDRRPEHVYLCPRRGERVAAGRERALFHPARGAADQIK
jgi:hypothetical protein